jgi:hypothetical protein
MKYSKYLDADKKLNVGIVVGAGLSLGSLLCAVSNAVTGVVSAVGANVFAFVHLF